MEKKINVAELLKDCPSGMELDCTMFIHPVTFDKVINYVNENYPIVIKTHNGSIMSFTKYGTYTDAMGDAKCVIYPKGKTTWEGFHRPFKDGDIVTYDNPHRANLQVFIFKSKKENNTLSSCYLMLDGDELDLEEDMYYVTRLATEEEKQKLFDAIKANGYRWNNETKTLERLIVPKFKVGDVIQDIDLYKVKITEVNIEDECYGYESVISKGIGGIGFNEQDNWELVPNKYINILKPFDKVLVRDKSNEVWTANFYSHYDATSDKPFICVGWSEMNEYRYCIPYEENKHLLGTTNDCEDYYKTW